jgi:hypothetical protein
LVGLKASYLHGIRLRFELGSWFRPVWMEESMTNSTNTKSTGRLRRVVMATALVAAGALTLGTTATSAQAQCYPCSGYGYYPHYYAPYYTYYPYYHPYYGYPAVRVGWGWGRGWGWGGGWRGGWHSGWHRW